MAVLRTRRSPSCYPVTLEEARRHLAVDASDRSVDSLIEMLIASATSDAENKTGRIWVDSDWLWKPDELKVGEEIAFPVAPVTAVAVYDLDEDVDEGQDRTDLSGELVKCVFPSPEPQGSPLIGSLLPIAEFPANYEIILTIGYPVTETEKPVEQFDAPTLVTTEFSENRVHLVFTRPVSGTATVENFSLKVGDEDKELSSVEFADGSVDLVFSDGVLAEGEEPVLTFIGGAIADQFNNFVEPISNLGLGTVAFVTEFSRPEPVPTTPVYTANTPSPVKNWILTRVGSLFSQRTEIALRAGKSNDAMFPDGFINNLLNPYKIRFA